MNASRELLSFRQVSIAYGGVETVSDVSFDVAPGTILGLVGESGSGKSTLLKAAMGLLPPGARVTRGSILFDGKDVTKLPERLLRRIRGPEIGMVFQDAGASFCPVRTVGDQIAEMLAAHGPEGKKEARERTLELFGRLRLHEPERLWSAYPFELSGGMRQRVGLAAVLLLRPRLILADEPTSALDAVVQKKVLLELRKFRDERPGSAVVFVTHDMSVVEFLADSVVVLQKGRVCESGPRASVFSDPKDAYTRRLLEAAPKLRRPA